MMQRDAVVMREFCWTFGYDHDVQSGENGINTSGGGFLGTLPLASIL